MTDIRIELHSIPSGKEIQDSYRTLEVFVGAVKEKKMLKSLSIQWVTCVTRRNCTRHAGWSWHFNPLSRRRKFERNSEEEEEPEAAA